MAGIRKSDGAMYPPLESDLLRIFVAVAQAGNVTHAGEKLGRTQSAVNMQVRKLEEAVGLALFERGPRGVTLTMEGERLLPYARRIVGLVDETTAAMRTLPLGTAYGIWTGIGALGAVVVGQVLFKEPATAGRMFFAALLLIGIVGLKLTSPS